MKNNIWLRIFSLPFIAVGIWMVYTIGATLSDAARMQSWDSVPAIITSGGYETNSGDDSTTYKAYAQYRYTYNGRDYTGDRVGLIDMSDNIGSFHQDMGDKLSKAARSKKPMDIFVNPNDPSESIVTREIRWGMIAFQGLFLVLFGGVGTGLMLYTFMAAPEPNMADYGDTPWMAEKDWAQNQIPSGSKIIMYFAWGFAALWNLVSAPLPFVLYEEITEKQNYPALLGLLFPLVGIGLIVWAIRRTVHWRKFGQSYLQLDPFPGSIGGQVGGTIELHYPYDPAQRYIITLSSIYSYTSGSGKNRRRREKLNWQDTAVAHTEMGLYGTRIVFRFDVPEGLPPSQAGSRGDEYEMWRLNLAAALPGVDLDMDYDIPVYETGKASSLTGREIDEAAKLTADMSMDGAKSRIRLVNSANGTGLFYPFGRNLGPTCTALLCGILFTAGGYFLVFHEGMKFFGGIFLLFGVPITLGGLYMPTNSLFVEKDAAGNIVSTRRIFGIPVRKRYIYAGDIRELQKSSNFSTSSGNKHIKHYTVYAKLPDGKKVVFGEGFHGEREANSAIELMKNTFGIRSAT